MNEITIGETALTVKEYQGKRVVTFKDIDTVHGRPDGTAGRNFRANKEHFIEGEDFYKVTSDEFRRAIGEMDSRQQNDVTLITESGYLMLVKSFTDDLAWKVQRELVNCYFRITQRDSYQIDDPIERAKRWIAEQEERAQLALTVSVQNQQIAELQPKASYYDVVLNCKDLLSIGKIAKDFGKSAVWLNKWLHEKGVQYKQGDIWLLYQKYAEMGYTSTKTQTFAGDDGETHSKVHTYWTQKGRLFIYSMLKADGILPLVEQDKPA